MNKFHYQSNLLLGEGGANCFIKKKDKQSNQLYFIFHLPTILVIGQQY